MSNNLARTPLAARILTDPAFSDGCDSNHSGELGGHNLEEADFQMPQIKWYLDGRRVNANPHVYNMHQLLRSARLSSPRWLCYHLRCKRWWCCWRMAIRCIRRSIKSSMSDGRCSGTSQRREYAILMSVSMEFDLKNGMYYQLVQRMKDASVKWRSTSDDGRYHSCRGSGFVSLPTRKWFLTACTLLLQRVCLLCVEAVALKIKMLFSGIAFEKIENFSFFFFERDAKAWWFFVWKMSNVMHHAKKISFFRGCVTNFLCERPP